ncbi:MAG: nitroreductase/quinone reductase family protein [Ilumatobacteraceae bacterium]
MPLHYVDPHKTFGRWYRALERFGRSRSGDFMARRVFWHIDPFLYRVTGGLYPRIMGGLVTAPLASTGAKTGQSRQHQLAYFHDGADVILIASYAGEPKHPQWYYNLKANPECRMGGEGFLATEVTDSDEYERLYALAERVCVNYGDYRAKSSAVGRRIPVLRLKPR